MSRQHGGSILGPSTVPSPDHERSHLGCVTQSRALLQSVDICHLRSAAGLLSMSGFPQCHLASSELWMCHAVASKSHAPMSKGVCV